MNKRKTFAILFVMFALLTFAQTSSDGIIRGNANPNEIYTPLKPADGKGAVFNTQAELNSKIQSKKDNMIAMINANINDPVKVKYYREELWRFENAIVQTP